MNQLERLGRLSFFFLDCNERHPGAKCYGSRLFSREGLKVLVLQTLSHLVKRLFMYHYYDRVKSISLEMVDLVRDKRLKTDWQTRYWEAFSREALRLLLVQNDAGAGRAELVCKPERVAPQISGFAAVDFSPHVGDVDDAVFSSL